MDDFLLRALAAGIGVAAVAGPLGAFVVWRRMAYFGDTLAHSALLGVALGLVAGVAPMVGIVGVAAAAAALLAGLQRQKRLAADTLLGIMSHAALSLGLVALAFMESVRVDLMAYLFGDILAVSMADIAWIYAGGGLALTLLALIWRPLLAATVNEELARVEGVNVGLAHFGLMLMMALVVAAAMKVVGVLLITSLLIIPAATARGFARTPEAMAALAGVAGMLAVAGGLAGSFAYDTPSGPSIVVAAALILVATLPLRRFVSARR